MSAFEFFFSFYGLLLGLCVAELVGGFARTLHERHRVHFGWRTPLLALFLAIDIATFWNQAWVIFRAAPFNLALLILGLAIAATFYIAASVTFPRLSEDATSKVDLDQHFWNQRRVIFSCVMAANLIVALLLLLLAMGNAEFARIAATPRLWVGTSIFVLCSATAAFAPSRKAASVALVLVSLYTLWSLSMAAAPLFQSGGWSPAFGTS